MPGLLYVAELPAGTRRRQPEEAEDERPTLHPPLEAEEGGGGDRQADFVARAEGTDSRTLQGR